MIVVIEPGRTSKGALECANGASDAAERSQRQLRGLQRQMLGLRRQLKEPRSPTLSIRNDGVWASSQQYP